MKVEWALNNNVYLWEEFFQPATIDVQKNSDEEFVSSFDEWCKRQNNANLSRWSAVRFGVSLFAEEKRVELTIFRFQRISLAFPVEMMVTLLKNWMPLSKPCTTPRLN